MSHFPNPPASVEPETFSVRRTVSIAAPIEKVWAAVTERDHLVKWFPQRAELPPVERGTRGVFTFEGYGDFEVMVEELDPPHMIAYRWGNELAAPVPVEGSTTTVFRFTLEPIEGGTQLTVVETGFDSHGEPAASMEDNRGGWTHEIDELVDYLEGAG